MSTKFKKSHQQEAHHKGKQWPTEEREVQGLSLATTFPPQGLGNQRAAASGAVPLISAPPEPMGIVAVYFPLSVSSPLVFLKYLRFKTGLFFHVSPFCFIIKCGK